MQHKHTDLDYIMQHKHTDLDYIMQHKHTDLDYIMQHKHMNIDYIMQHKHTILDDTMHHHTWPEHGNSYCSRSMRIELYHEQESLIIGKQEHETETSETKKIFFRKWFGSRMWTLTNL